MHTIPGFEILEKIKEGSTAVIYRARKQNSTYILKVMATEYPSDYELARFLNEYETLRQIESDVIIRAEEVLEKENSIILVLEDFQGKSLKEVYADRSIDISEFLKIAISIARALEAIHTRGISHRDLKPQNILINPNTGQLKVTDFGLSSLQSSESEKRNGTGILEGTLPYISPEQTGRMNRQPDYRTDFYSLGVTLYELLTGRLPFPGNDPLEIIHSHLAVIAPEPHSVRADVFPILSKILMKLLAKIPEQRYQSATGLRSDLERCLAELETKGSISDFAVGMHESSTFRIPPRLYGRQTEVRTLLNAFQRVSEGSRELVVVSGPSGIGKTALVSEVREPLSIKNGYFLWGKFEEFKRDIPYSAIIVAFRGLIRSLLTESEDRLSRWRKNIQSAVDQNGQLIVNVIPELEVILGKQPSIPEVSPAEAQNRFSYTIQEFVRVFADESHPLTIFLDDIQWADRASLNLLEWVTLNPDLTHFLAIVSYRDRAAAPFVSECLQNIHAKGGEFREITLQELDRATIGELLSETFFRDGPTVESLADQLIKRTGGNPFFVREFLRTLQERSLIYIQNEWKWDMELIETSGITENVAELLTHRLDHLPDRTIQCLKLGATIGNRFALEELSKVQGVAGRQIFADLKPALDEGFLNVDGPVFVFVHDRVREAAYGLLSPSEKDSLHYRIGTSRLASLTDATDDEAIFSIVNQLGAGKTCITDSDERAGVVSLAVRAAQAARGAAAFQSAVDYLNLAVEFLPADPWNTAYDQTLRIYTDLAESQYSSTNFEEAQRLFDLVLSHARTVLDKVRIFQMQVESLVPQNRLAEAIESARHSLKQLGLTIPARAGKFTALPGLLRVKRKIGKNIEDLSRLPDMTNPQDLAKMHLLMQTIAPAFIANPNLFPVLLLKMVNMTLEKGLCPESAYAFAGLGLILGAALGEYDSGYRLGNLARSILQKHKSGQMLCKVLFIHGNMIHHWTRPSRESQAILYESYASGIESGELQFAAYSCNWFNAYNLLIRTDLRSTLSSMARTENTMQKFRQKDQYYFFSMWRQFATQLTNPDALYPELSGDYFQEKVIVPEWIESRNFTDLFGFHLTRCIMHYLRGDYPNALEAAKRAWNYQSGVFGMAVVPELNFFESLSLAGLAHAATSRWKRNRLLARIKRNQRRMKVWARHSPENYESKYLLIRAEEAALRGKHSQAIQFYNESIRTATEYKYRLEIALANQLCARFFLASDIPRVAESYLLDAHYSFQRFGITHLSKRLEQDFPLLFGRRNEGSLPAIGEQTYTGDSVASNSSNPQVVTTANQRMDLRTVIRCTQAISGEIFLDQLIDKLMHQVIENAGAERCYLFLLEDNTLLLAAEADVGGTSEAFHLKAEKSETLDSLHKILSVGIVQYCQRTGEHVILDNAIESGPFTADPYIQRSRSKSVLCIPIQKGALLVGILYLENNLLSHAFTPDRLELLQILASQAAISIENARLAREEADRASAFTEMQLARDVQISILPTVLDDSAYRVSAFMLPAAKVGGDYYDFVRKNDMRWFAIGDVAGHGLYSGLVMLMAQTGFGMYLKSREQPDLIELYTTLNAQLHDNIVTRTGNDVYMTLTVFCADESGTVRYTGKHQDLLVYRQESGKTEVYPTDGVWLGILPNIAPPAEAGEIRLQSGDMLILYSDGVLECRNRVGEQFDKARLISTIEQYAPNGPEALQAGIRKACFDFLEKQEDDLTVMVIQKR